MTEQDIQNQIRLKLSELGYMTERINVGTGVLIPMELKNQLDAFLDRAGRKDLKDKLARCSYFNTGAVKGRSDLSAIKDGKISFIEVKKPGGKVRDEQVTFLKAVKEIYGCKGGIAYSVEDALKIVGEG